MTTTFTFQKAERRAVKLKIGVDGPSGSGKTMGALAIAHGITGGGRVAVADSENGSASLYANRFAFDTVIVPDALPETYKAIIDAAAAAGYDALVIDSLSHAWLTVLAEKEDHDRKNPKSNSWTNWRIFGPRWDSLMQHILQAPIHVIATMRSKQAYEQVDNGGRKQVVKLGMQPQVRDGAEYEFGLVFSVDQSHQAEATKDRTELFADRRVDLCDARLHQELVRWMNAGGPASGANGAKAQRPAGDPAAVIQPTGAATPSPAAPPRATPTSNAVVSTYPGDHAPEEMKLAWASSLPLRGAPEKWGGNGRKPIGEVPSDVLEAAAKFFGEKHKANPDPALDAQVKAARVVLADREKMQTALELESKKPEPEPVAAGMPNALKDPDDDGLPF